MGARRKTGICEVNPTSPSKIAEPVRRTGHVSVFISRKEKKLYVRQGFMPLFDIPVVIERPDQPLGTHVYTAMELTQIGTQVRWNVMSLQAQIYARTEPQRHYSIVDYAGEHEGTVAATAE